MNSLDNIVKQFALDFPDKLVIISRVENENEKYICENVRYRDNSYKKITKHYYNDNEFGYEDLVRKYNHEYDVYRANREKWFNPCPT